MFYVLTGRKTVISRNTFYINKHTEYENYKIYIYLKTFILKYCTPTTFGSVFYIAFW